MRTRSFEKDHASVDQAQRFNSGEYHVCGVIVDTNPAKTQDIMTIITAMDGCEIHHTDPEKHYADVRFIVVVEDTETISSYDQMNNLQKIEGVLSVSLMSHFFDQP